MLKQFVLHFLSSFFIFIFIYLFIYFWMNEEILLTEKLLHVVQKTERLKSTLLQKKQPAPAAKRQATKLS